MYAQNWFKGKITFVEMDLNPPLKPEGRSHFDEFPPNTARKETHPQGD